MKKKLFLFSFILLFVLSAVKTNTFAYSSVYYNNQNIKIALESMRAGALDIVLNGDYNFNGNVLASGTSVTIKVDSGRLLMDGVYYDSIAFAPINADSFISVKKGADSARNYHGSFTFKVKYGTIYAVNTLNIEDYVKGVVGYEMSDYFDIEALKAQAVASRTLGVYKIKAGSEYDMVDTESSQVYRGFDNSFKNVEQAVESTRGEIIFYNGYVIEALFSANHGGYSEDAANVWGNAVDYLKSNKDDFDDYNKYDNSRSYDWTVTYNSEQLTDLLNKYLASSGNQFTKINLSTLAYYTSGRVSNLEIDYVGADGTNKVENLVRIKARDFFGFKSSMYTVAYDSILKTYTFIGHGSGHGLGMSQIGALNRARGGQTYKDILSFYYSGSIVDKRSASILSASLSSSEVLTGRSISLEVQGQGGSGPSYQYKFVIEKDGEVQDIIDYSNNSTLSYDITKTGNYTIAVYLKDALSQAVYDDKRTLSFTAVGFADINGDSKVDLFDMVLISRNLNKAKDSNSQLDMRMDLVNDGVIDMLDLAAAARNYNVSY